MNQVFTLPVGPNINDLGAIVPVGQVRAQDRQVDLRAGAKIGDKVGLLGSTNGTDFNPVLVTPPTAPAVSLELSVPRAMVPFTNACTHYRTIRLGRAEGGSALAEVGLVAEQLLSNSAGMTVEREFDMDFAEFSALGAGVKTFTKTVVDAADIPGGAVVVALVGDGLTFVAFNDGTNPVTHAFLGFPPAAELLDTMDVGNGATGDVEPFYGNITLGNLYLPATDILFSITGANDLKDYTSGHLRLKLVLAVPAGF